MKLKVNIVAIAEFLIQQLSRLRSRV